MMLKKFSIIFLCVITGCTNLNYATDADDKIAKKFKTNSKMSGVYLFRDENQTNLLGNITVTLDDAVMGNISSNSFFSWYLPEGKHTIKVYYGSTKTTLEIETEKNKNYFIQQIMNNNSHRKVILKEVSEEFAIKKIKEGKLLKPTNNIMFFSS